MTESPFLDLVDESVVELRQVIEIHRQIIKDLLEKPNDWEVIYRARACIEEE